MRLSRVAAPIVLVLALAGCSPDGRQPAPAEPLAARCPAADRPPASLLPEDRPVGRGTLVYRPCPNCAPALVTGSGEQYHLVGPPPRAQPTAPLPDASPGSAPPPAPIALDPMFGLRLSPDGRWLVRADYEGLLLRDLTGTATRRIGRGDLGAWSADGRFVVMVSRVPGTDTGTTELVEVATGTRRPVRLPWGQVLAVLGPDKVLAARGYNREQSDPDPSRETYAVVDPATGTVRREITVDAGRQTNTYPGATIAMGNLLVGVLSPLDGSTQEILAIAVDSGRVIGRHRLPDEAPGGYPAWRLAGISGDQVVLIREVSFGSPSPGAPGTVSPSPVRLFLMDPVTGDQRPACTLPARSEVILPG